MAIPYGMFDLNLLAYALKVRDCKGSRYSSKKKKKNSISLANKCQTGKFYVVGI